MTSPQRLRLAILVAGTLATIGFLWLTRLPLGVRGEWTWDRIVVGDEPGAVAEMWLGAAQAAAAAAVYIGLAAYVAPRLEGARRAAVVLCLALLVVAAFVWLGIIQDSPPGVYGLQKSPLVLYAPSMSGYFFHARFEIDDTTTFLRGYEAWVSQGDVLHFGTHPPGLFLFHHGLNRLCESSPGLVRLLIATQPESVREALDLIARVPMGAPATITDVDRASLWLAALLTQLAAALAVVPLYGVLRRTCGRQSSWLAACLWPLVPALAIFLPKSDALYPFFGMLFLWAWLAACGKRSAPLGIAAGALLSSSLCFSLAFLPVAALAGALWLFDVARVAPCGGDGLSKPTESVALRIRPVAGAIAGFLLPIATAWFAFGLNLPAVWFQNYRNHAAFYGQYHRTWWKWLLVNPIEMAMAVGWPVFAMAAATLAAGIAMTNDATPEARRPRRWISLCCAAVWGLLWITGKNSGEAARLWLILMPWTLWVAGLTIESSMATPATTTPSQRPWVALLSLQAVACIATVLRVAGFQFQF